LFVHAVVPPHVPFAVHVCVALPEHCVCDGPQMPWHVPPTHVWLTHATGFPQAPADEHVCVAPSPEHWTAPGEQLPWHVADTPPSAEAVQVEFVQGTAAPQVPVLSQV
jgi:hypothetical protein